MLKTSGLDRGFTLVEMAVVLAVIGLLMMAAAPSYSSYIANSNLRNTAGLFYSAAQKARTEAIRRNDTIELVLTNDTPPVSDAANVGTAVMSLVESATGTNWVIRAPNAVGSDRLIDSKVATELGGAAITVNAGSTTKIQFNGLGETTSASTVLVQFRHASQNTECLLTGGVRCVNVRISGGGKARLCEPNQPTTDNRSC